MRNRRGITEIFWANWPEDKKIGWKLFTWSTAALASLLITKTGIRLFDWLVVIFSSLSALLVIESQRSLRRYARPLLRKWLIRVAVALITSGVVLLGIAFFVSAGVAVAGDIVVRSLQGFPSHATTVVDPWLFSLTIIGCVFIALIRAFRQLQIEELVHRLPRAALKRLLIERPFVVANFWEFAFFELTVIFLAYLYCSAVAGIANIFISTLHL